MDIDITEYSHEVKPCRYLMYLSNWKPLQGQYLGKFTYNATKLIRMKEGMHELIF